MGLRTSSLHDSLFSPLNVTSDLTTDMFNASSKLPRRNLDIWLSPVDPWSDIMTYFNAPVLLALFIFILPFYQSFEVIFGFLVINYLIVPVSFGEYREAFSTESIQAAIPDSSREYCFAGD